MAKQSNGGEIKLEWVAPPPQGDPSEYLTVIEELKEQPNEWARLRVWPQGSSGAYSAKKRLVKAYPDDYEFLARKQPDGTIGLFGRYIATET